jgi:hypothetical protein
MTPTQLIHHLNSITIGELDPILAKLDQARQACLELHEHELAQQLGEAGTALGQADAKTYRKRVESVVARLGHLK